MTKYCMKSGSRGLIYNSVDYNFYIFLIVPFCIYPYCTTEKLFSKRPHHLSSFSWIIATISKWGLLVDEKETWSSNWSYSIINSVSYEQIFIMYLFLATWAPTIIINVQYLQHIMLLYKFLVLLIYSSWNILFIFQKPVVLWGFKTKPFTNKNRKLLP